MRTSIGCVLIVGSLAFAGQAVASNDTWTNASGDSQWSNSANWSTGAVPTSNDDAIFDPTVSNVGSIVDLGGLARPVDSVGFNYTVSGNFQFQNGTLITRGIGAIPGQQLYSVNISTPSTSLFVASQGNTQFTGVIGGNGVGSDNFDLYAYGGVFTAANTYTGITHLSDPIVPVVLNNVNGSIAASSEIDMNGGILELDNRITVNNNRVADKAPINCLTGTITFDGNATAASNETTGAVALSQTKLNLNVYSNGAPAALTINSLARSGSAVLQLSLASSAGAMPGQVFIQNAASLPLVGGGGTAGSTNQSILPYAIGDRGSFVTYDFGPDGKPGTADDLGLRPLNVSTEYLPSVPGASGADNIRITTSQTLSQSATVNALSVNNASLTIPGSQQLQLNSGALSLSGASTELTAITGGSINFNGGEAVIYTDGPASGAQPRYVVDSQLQNASSITKFGTGTLVLTQPSTFSGQLTIQEGMVASRANGALGSGSIVFGIPPTYNSVPVGISFENSNQTFSNNLSEVLNTTNSTLWVTLNVASGVEVDFSGTTGAPIMKTGPGTLRMTLSSSVTNSGTQPIDFDVEGGTFRVDSAVRADILVGPSHAAVFGGSGTLDAVQLYPYGVLWPGAGGQNGSDVLTVGHLVMERGAFHVSLNGTVPGLQYDQVDVTNIMGFLGADLDVTVGYGARISDHFMIINNLTNYPTYGSFAGLPEGSVFSADGDQFQITYQGGDGNDVVLTVLSTPEPSAIAFAAACLAGLLLRRRARALLEPSARQAGTLPVHDVGKAKRRPGSPSALQTALPNPGRRGDMNTCEMSVPGAGFAPAWTQISGQVRFNLPNNSIRYNYWHSDHCAGDRVAATHSIRRPSHNTSVVSP